MVSDFSYVVSGFSCVVSGFSRTEHELNDGDSSHDTTPTLSVQRRSENGDLENLVLFKIEEEEEPEAAATLSSTARTTSTAQRTQTVVTIKPKGFRIVTPE